jgi:hypothetical protein
MELVGGYVAEGLFGWGRPLNFETSTGDASFVSSVGENAFTVVAVERVAGFDVAAVAITSVDEINVLPAVAVKIRRANSRTELLKIDGDAVVAFEVGEANAGFFRDVGEVD